MAQNKRGSQTAYLSRTRSNSLRTLSSFVGVLLRSTMFRGNRSNQSLRSLLRHFYRPIPVCIQNLGTDWSWNYAYSKRYLQSLHPSHQIFLVLQLADLGRENWRCEKAFQSNKPFHSRSSRQWWEGAGAISWREEPCPYVHSCIHDK